MLVVLDNRDSFVWNLVQAFERLGEAVRVVRAWELGLDEVGALDPSRLVLGPGPGGPQAARASLAALDVWAGRVPVLGVCLGLQVVAHHAGARVVRGEPVHGHATRVEHDGRGLFAGVPSPFVAGRYHSLRVAPGSLPPVLEATAWTPDGAVMGLRRLDVQVEAVQFHPESILSQACDALLGNFLRSEWVEGAGGRGWV